MGESPELQGVPPIGDEAVRVLLAERGAEVARLAGRVEQLMGDRISTEAFLRLVAEQKETSQTLQKVEFAVFGADGNNGLLSSVRGLKKDLEDMRKEELTDLKDEIIESRRQARNLVLTFISAGAVLVGSLLAAPHIHF